MARSIKKGPFCDEHLMKKVEKLNDKIIIDNVGWKIF